MAHVPPPSEKELVHLYFEVKVLRERPVITMQGYLAHKKTPTPLGPPKDPRHRPAVGS